ncbi:MAG TPA: efflux RND transporter periplasmic adaptor subunit [Rhodospirillaceae bacterium]|nr:efflux RND transporter periplasmic adaptor subunit [Rhodospirillaceae bacterium]
MNDPWSAKARFSSLIVLTAAVVLSAGVGAAPLEPEIRAQVVAADRAMIGAGMSGRLDDVFFRDGEDFKTEDILVSFQCDVQKAHEKRAFAILQKQLKVAEINERLRQIGSLSVKQIFEIEAQVMEARAEHEVAEALLKRCEIIAPFSGRVSDVVVKRYEHVNEGQAIIEIYNPSTLEVEAIVPSSWITWLKQGYAFTVFVDELKRSYNARALIPSGKVDPVSQSLKVRGRIEKPDNDLLPGMSGRIVITLPEDQQNK